MKGIAIAACAAITVAVCGAEESRPAEDALEKTDDRILSGWVNVDFMSAYIWRNTVVTDEMVLQPSVGADFVYLDPFYAGFSIWQGYDLTGRRSDALTHGLTETDYNLHVGTTAWENDEGDMALALELAHEWYDNEFVREGAGNGSPDVQEIYVRAQFSNPLVDVYGQASWRYLDLGDYKSGMHYEVGFNKEVPLCDEVSAGADWNVNFGDGHYLNTLYGGTFSGRNAAGEKEYDGSSGGFGGTTVKAYLVWQATEWFSLTGLVAYTGLLNGAYREALGEQGDGAFWGGDSYPRDFFWGGVTAKVSF